MVRNRTKRRDAIAADLPLRHDRPGDNTVRGTLFRWRNRNTRDMP
jgi:hypothetical protein